TDVGRVIELIGEEPPVLDSHPLRHVAEVVAARRWGIGRDHDLRSQRGERLALVNRHLLRHHADEVVAAGSGHEREPNAGIPRGGFYERHPGTENASLLRVVDDRERDAILDGASGVHVLALHEHRHRKARRDARETHEWRAPDALQDIPDVAHLDGPIRTRNGWCRTRGYCPRTARRTSSAVDPRRCFLRPRPRARQQPGTGWKGSRTHPRRSGFPART